MDWMLNPDIWISLLTLTALEIVLGIDNVIFLSILVERLEPVRRKAARRLGLGLALIMRILLLLSINWMVKLEQELFSLLGHGFSGRDLILLLGGLFLIAKSTHEIHQKVEGRPAAAGGTPSASFSTVIVQVVLLDIVFSLDSVITAVGMAKHVGVMIAAVVISVFVMLVCAGSISAFVNRHPTVRILALSFLLLIGMALMADGLHHEIPRGYVYSAMGFAMFVEVLNLRARARGEAVHLREPFEAGSSS
ncbi:MAG: TerC family protein [Planctomycetota bacterium]|jgi:predicted tellurium resistance membrane protein TerC